MTEGDIMALKRSKTGTVHNDGGRSRDRFRREAPFSEREIRREIAKATNVRREALLNGKKLMDKKKAARPGEHCADEKALVIRNGDGKLVGINVPNHDEESFP
jgi:hypothetical protein